MMQRHNKKKKKRPVSLASKPIARDGDHSQQSQQKQQNQEQKHEGTKVVEALMEAFDSFSVEEAEEAYREAKGDIDKAAQILANLMENSEDPSTSSVSSGLSGFGLGSSSSSSTGSSSASRDGFLEGNLVNRKGFRGGNKQKKVLAVTGTVSTVLGKEYVKASPRRDSVKAKGFGNGVVEKEAEQFLCSMLGNDCELSMGVVRDVLCQCGYDVEKALNALLDLSASSHEQSRRGRDVNNSVNYKEDARFFAERSDNLNDVASDYTSHSSEGEFQDSVWGCGYRNYCQALAGFEAPSSTTPIGNESNIPQKVLECLFNVPKSSEHEPSTMNWRNVVKKMQSLGPGFDVFPSNDALPQQNSYDNTIATVKKTLNNHVLLYMANGEEYHLFRESAKGHWNSRTSYYHKAAAAYSKGERGYAAYLSDQGRIQTKLAREADEKASQNIFKARNKDIANVLTIDLHGQHVKQAMRVLKLHLLFGKYVRSIQTLRVITGCGSHGLGKSKVKQAVTRLLENEGIEWREENQGVLLIKIDGYKEYSFLDIDSDTD